MRARCPYSRKLCRPDPIEPGLRVCRSRLRSGKRPWRQAFEDYRRSRWLRLRRESAPGNDRFPDCLIASLHFRSRGDVRAPRKGTASIPPDAAAWTPGAGSRSQREVILDSGLRWYDHWMQYAEGQEARREPLRCAELPVGSSVNPAPWAGICRIDGRPGSSGRGLHRVCALRPAARARLRRAGGRYGPRRPWPRSRRFQTDPPRPRLGLPGGSDLGRGRYSPRLRTHGGGRGARRGSRPLVARCGRIADRLEVQSVGRSLGSRQGRGCRRGGGRQARGSRLRRHPRIGPRRLATESSVLPTASHPFWARPFPDVRHRPQRPDHRLLPVAQPPGTPRIPLHDGERQRADRGVDLRPDAARVEKPDALGQSIREIDGVFTYLIADERSIGFAQGPVGHQAAGGHGGGSRGCGGDGGAGGAPHLPGGRATSRTTTVRRSPGPGPSRPPPGRCRPWPRRSRSCRPPARRPVVRASRRPPGPAREGR